MTGEEQEWLGKKPPEDALEYYGVWPIHRHRFRIPSATLRNLRIHATHQNPKMKSRDQFSWNLLAIAPVRKFIQQPIFPLALQIVALTGLGALAINGWGVGLSGSC